METHKAKRVAIIIEGVMERRLTETLEKSGIKGYSILPVLGGSGQSGPWSRDGQVSRATAMVQVICVIRPERLDGLLEAVFEVVDRYIGIVSVTDCEVIRAERF